MIESRLSYLFQQYFTKSDTPEERSEFMELLMHHENDEAVKKLLEESWQQFNSQNQVFSDSQGEQMLANILKKEKANTPIPAIISHKSTFYFLRIAAAAAVLFFAVTGVYLWLSNKQFVQPVLQATKTAPGVKDTIKPGGNKAVLTLSDGSSIILDSSQRGTLTKQGNAKVIKLNTGTLAYNVGNENNAAIVYNTLSTPSGGQYQLILPDGTKVWLNSASSIQFPTIFKGNQRNVSVTGEVYFEVAKNPAMPFKITVKDMEVSVLGTHFNIMAYNDESSMNTTLLEGSIKVSKNGLNKMLVPGQQSKISKSGAISIVEPDMEEVMAWKNGWFHFDAYDIQKVMRQISKWYDVEIIYEGKIPTGHFSGQVSRANDISQVLKIMQSGGVRFKIDGRKVIVLS